MRLVQKAHDLLLREIQEGDMAVDATVGNGHDTVFLAQIVGDSGRVYGFDVQATAIHNTRERLQQAGLAHRVVLIQSSHEVMDDQLPASLRENIAAIVFNLGYLPGSDKSIITQSHSTRSALSAASGLIKPGGVISVMVYPDHPGGEEESAEVQDWIVDLGMGWEPECFKGLGKSKGPVLYVVKKR